MNYSRGNCYRQRTTVTTRKFKTKTYFFSPLHNNDNIQFRYAIPADRLSAKHEENIVNFHALPHNSHTYLLIFTKLGFSTI